ncbi:transposase IS4 family protein, partial [mine drainage metagenome]
YEPANCAGCPLAPQCLRKGQEKRKISRDEYDGMRERVAASRRAGTHPGRTGGLCQTSRRAGMAESPFGIIKQTMNFRRFLLRGIAKVRMEWRWVATAFPDSHRDPN